MVLCSIHASKHTVELPIPRAYPLHYVEDDPDSRGLARATLARQGRSDNGEDRKEEEDMKLSTKGCS